MFALIPFFLGSLNKNVSIWYEGVSCHSMSLDAILESWGGTTGLCSLGRFVATFAFTPDVKVWEVKFSRLGEFEKVARAFDLIGHSSGAQLHLVPTRANGHRVQGRYLEGVRRCCQVYQGSGPHCHHEWFLYLGQ